MSERSLFIRALEIDDPAERARLLAQDCGGDDELRSRIEQLLAAHSAAGGILDKPPVEPLATDLFRPITELPGAQIGPYKLREKIGEGGFGVVYVAEQEKPVRRKVALKIIKPGMDTKDVIARFEAERQALALMDHPNVARVLDAGATESGRPYFVMELVNGVPITEFCDKNNLSTRDRLLLFADVCRAVQHAHQKGIIHRDLKPSNIMVTLHDGRPVAKVIDFGVSKALSQQLTEKSIYTAYGQMIGTPSYMSPEQAEMSGLGIDTRSDIYSLGVLLYELLTGTTPLDSKRLRASAYAEILRIIREEEPQRPSLKISTLGEQATVIAKQRHTDPAQLRRELAGELDWIVLKCLEKDRARRYETASNLARDVERYLNDEQVEACPPTTAYRLRKFLHKHRAGALTAGMVALTMLIGTLASYWQAYRAAHAEQRAVIEAQLARQAKEAEASQRKRAEANAQVARQSEQLANDRLALVEAERKRAEEEKQISQAVRDFLQNKLLGQTDAENQADALIQVGGLSSDIKENPTIRELLDRAALQLTEDRMEVNFPHQPRLQAEILKMVGDSYRSVGEYQKAVGLFQRSLALSDRVLSPDDPVTLKTRSTLGNTYHAIGQVTEAIVLLEQVRDAQVRVLGEEHADTLITLNNLAVAYRLAGKQAEAIALLEEVRDVAVRVRGSEHRDTLESLTILGAAYVESGRTTEAITLLERIRDVSERGLGPQHPITLAIHINLAAAYYHAGKTTEAIGLLEEVRDATIRILGPDHPGTLLTRSNLASAYLNAGKTEEAIALMEQIGDACERVLGLEHPNTITARNNLAMAYLKAGRKTEGLAMLEKVREVADRIFGPEHPKTLTTLTGLASAYKAAGRTSDAIALFEQVREVRVRVLGPEHPSTLIVINNLAAAYWNSKQLDKSIPLFEETLRMQEKQLGRAHPDTLRTVANLGVNYKDAGRLENAIPLLEEVHRASRTIPALRSYEPQLLDAYGQAGKTSEAINVLEQVYDEKLNLRGPDHPETMGALGAVAGAYVKAEKWTEAIPLFERIHDQQLRLHGPDHRIALGALTALAGIYLKADEPTKAIPLFKKVREKQLTLLGPNDPAIKGTTMGLALALMKTKEWRDAELLLREALASREKSVPDNLEKFITQSMLGEALLGQQKYDEAEPLLVTGYQGMLQHEKQIPPQGRWSLTESLERLVKLYTAWDKPTEAANWRQILDDHHTANKRPVNQTEK